MCYDFVISKLIQFEGLFFKQFFFKSMSVKLFTLNKCRSYFIKERNTTKTVVNLSLYRLDKIE